MNNPMNNLSTMQFERFMQQMRGINPTAIINQLLSSGQITQQQLNEAQRHVKSIEPQFSDIRKKFGF